MSIARTLRNDREKMGEHPMYRPSRGHGQSQPQPHQATGQSRIRRGDDPLAELARLIGQEDPFKEFDAVQPRRAPANGSGAGHAPTVAPERRADRYTNGNGSYSNGAGQVQRQNGRDDAHLAPRQSTRYAQPAAAPARAPAARGYEEHQRPSSRPVSRDVGGQYADRAHRAPSPYAEDEVRSKRAPVAPEQRTRRSEHQPTNRYVPEETPRHARSRPNIPYQDPQQRGFENDYDPQYDDDAYLPEHADDIYDDVQRQGRGWGFWIVAAIVVASLIAVAFLGMFAYRTVFNSPPRAAVVTKSAAPVKVEAKNTPQTAVSPSNKPIQDRVGGTPDQTQIMRREETPTDLTRQPQPQRAPQFTPPMQQQAPQQQQQPVPQNADQPKRVKSVPLRSDGAAQQPAPAPQSQNNAPIQLAPNSSAQEQDTQTVPQNRPNSNTPTVPRNTTVASLGPTTTTSGNYVVQVASHKTPEEAQGAWTNLRQQYAAIFNGRNADIRKVDLGDRGTFYRAMVGPMNRDQANALCQNLKTQGAGCIVQTR